MTPTAAISIPIASHVIDGGTIFLILLSLAAIIGACAALIYLSLWLTSKVNGSKGLVWGALLGVATAKFLPLLGFLVGQVPFSFLYESLLPSAVGASVLACSINVLIWFRRAKPDATGLTEGTAPE